MKKVFLTIALVLVFAFSAMAQTEGVGLTGKGIKAGIGLANLSGDIEDTDMKLGINGGAFITYNFTPMVAFQPELLFQMKGAKQSFEGVDDDMKYKANYLTVPMLLKLTPQMEGNMKPNFFIGPEVGFLMSAKVSMGDESEDIKDYLKSIDFGLAFGAGLGIQMETMMLTFDARYELGLTNINDEEVEDGEEEFEIKTSNIAVMVGLSF